MTLTETEAPANASATDSVPLEDYALIGNLHSAALISRAGSIDWFCPGRFDSPACFAALLGRRQHGFWNLAPSGGTVRRITREYLDRTLLLKTTYLTTTGTVEVLDYMPLQCGCHMVREVKVLEGVVTMETHLLPRFGYGRYQARVEEVGHIGAPCEMILQHEQDRLRLVTNTVVVATETGGAYGEFLLEAGEAVYFLLTSDADGGDIAPALDIDTTASQCADWWRAWADQCTYRGPWREEVVRSLIILKAMTYAPTGAIVAAPTTSLPEVFGGSANWDYRYTWPRDAALVLDVLLRCGYKSEAEAWRKWLVKAVSGSEGTLKTLYTIDGKIIKDETILDWLPGYGGARPVRVGNEADQQFQLDLRGEVIETLHLARKSGVELDPETWELQCRILGYVEHEWRDPDAGIWEARAEWKHYTHSKVFAWAAFDRSIHDAEAYQLPAPLDRWRQIRDQIKTDILAKAVHPTRNFFVRFYGDNEVDASLLMIPLLGFLPPDDLRVVATVTEIERHFCSPEGFVYRNPLAPHAAKEGAFLLCTCWLADYYMIAGREMHARRIFESLLRVCNDVGLLAEEYNPQYKALCGNFPQSFSHLSLVKSALLIGGHQKVEFSGEDNT